MWTTKSGNYVYLVHDAEGEDYDGTPFKVTDTTTYKLLDRFIIPTSITTLPNNTQYMAEVRFTLAFQAIQADNLDSMIETKSESSNVIKGILVS